MGQPMTPAWSVNLSSDTWLMGKGGNREPQELSGHFPFAGPCGDSSERELFSLQPHWHPGTESKKTSGMASAPVPGDGSRNSALLPPQLGHPAPTSFSKAEDQTGLRWLQWASSPMPSGLQEVVNWATPGAEHFPRSASSTDSAADLIPLSRADYGHTGLGNPTSPATKPKS